MRISPHCTGSQGAGNVLKELATFSRCWRGFLDVASHLLKTLVRPSQGVPKPFSSRTQDVGRTSPQGLRPRRLTCRQAQKAQRSEHPDCETLKLHYLPRHQQQAGNGSASPPRQRHLPKLSGDTVAQITRKRKHARTHSSLKTNCIIDCSCFCIVCHLFLSF